MSKDLATFIFSNMIENAAEASKYYLQDIAFLRCKFVQYAIYYYISYLGRDIR